MRLVILATAALALAACSAAAPASPTVTGTMTLVSASQDIMNKTATTCGGQGGYGDIRDGTDVVVKDAAGVIIGTGRLAFAPDLDKRGNVCVWTFDVPTKASDFYSLSVGHRDPVTYSQAEMEAQGWKVGLSLGP